MTPPSRFPSARARAVERMRQQLLRESFPRLQMMFIVAATGGVGLLASFGLLRIGLESMALRYPLALVVAYGAFLLLLWLWLRVRGPDLLDVAEFVPVGNPSGSGSVGSVPGFRSGGGGDFAGAGAGGSFDSAASASEEVLATPLRAAGKAGSSVADADELALPLLVLVLVAGLAVASLYVVYIAPVLLAEVLVDGALSYALFRRLRGEQGQHWLRSAVRKTALPFAATAVFLAGTGAAMAAYAPGAVSVGQVIHRAQLGKVGR